MRLQTLLHEALAFPEDLSRPIALGLEHVEELPPPSEERVELASVGVGDRAPRGAHHVGEARENIGIDAVGLRELTSGFREVAHFGRCATRDRVRRSG